MIVFLAAFSFLHIAFYLALSYGWVTIERREEYASDVQSFSVIIPARNEAHHILRLLQQLESQDHPTHAFEVIVVDDFSEDETVARVLAFAKRCEMELRLVRLEDPSKTGKKLAITRGVETAAYPLILTTDADCAVGISWISSYNQAFTPEVQMITGPVVLTGTGFFEKLQQLEFAGLMGFGAITLANGSPTVCSGANLGFRKSAFQQVGGYTDNLAIPSGDDEFLMHSIVHAYPTAVHFLKRKEAIVGTAAKKKLSAFMNQRIRWVSKWRFNKNKWVQFLSVIFFFDLLIYFVALGFAAAGLVNVLAVLAIAALRILSDFLFISSLNKFLTKRTPILLIFVLQIIYPVHVLFMGIKSIFGSYTWKGRKYG